MKHGGREYLPDHKGRFFCPWKCHDPNYPPKNWLTEKGFSGHLAKCKAKPEPELEYVAPATVGPEYFADCADCGEPILKLTSCWRMRDKITCIDCHEPYLESGMGHHDCAGLEFPGFVLEG